MSRKDTIDALFAKRPLGAPNTTAAPERDRVRTGAISAMGASLQHLTETAKVAARLQDQIDSGDLVTEVRPTDIDGSFITDRIVLDVDPSLDALVASMAESGQQVPILLRPHPESTGRYQIAYGHRRVRAAERLGVNIKAIVRRLTDAELVVAQGKENLERRDLSFIERAFFAKRLEDRGFDRAVVIAALSSDKADVSRYVSLARAIPEAIAFAIGPAPKVGRARWADLAGRLANELGREIAEAAISKAEFLSLDSDARFATLFDALRPPQEGAATAEVWTVRDGRAVARIERGSHRFVLALDERVAPAFGDYILKELGTLFAAYERSKEKLGR
jgi:ParB family chromosome partitioning protein